MDLTGPRGEWTGKVGGPESGWTGRWVDREVSEPESGWTGRGVGQTAGILNVWVVPRVLSPDKTAPDNIMTG